ncbi:MAG: Ig-like domain-containing protein, partial [Bacteroidota bacterium]
MKKLLAFLLYFTLSGLLLANTGFFPNHPITVERDTIEICPDINDNNAMMPELIAVQESITAADVSVTVHITVKDFNNFVGISHMLVWDPSVLRIDQTLPSNSLTNLNTSISPFVSPGQFSARNDSTLGFSWIQFNPSFPQSLANGDTLYSIVFDVVGNIGSGTLLREFPDNERPPELVRPRNQLSIPSGNASAGIPYVGVNTIITTSSSGNNPPSVSFTSPFDGQNFVTGSTLNVTASASDSDGTVTGVEFFYDGISQGTDGLVPYQWSISNLAGGIHTLRVVATDNDGATSQSTITINVSSPNAPPTVSFITPNNGQTFNEGDNINVNVSASDSDGGITGVELFYDNISQGVMNTAPYQWTIFNLAAGTHNLRAEATDDDGAISQTAITINVNAAANIPPTVSFISPSNGQVFTAGDNLNIQASAGDSDGSIANVEFFYNNVSQGADNSSPYTWSISNLAAGTQTLQVIATDDDGATTQQTITITVNSISGLPGPVSDCITTRNFAVANSTINIGTYQATENITTTGSISINPSDEVIFQAGQSITLTEGFIAKPSAGSFTARIRPCTFVNNSPLVFFTQPLNADILDEGKDLVVTADASDPFGAVANVQFYFDGILQGTDNIAPYQWFVPSLTLGTHTLQVIVTDDMGATAQETITITVDNLNDAPTVFFTQPLDGDNLLTGSDIDVIASASDADGTITMVELFYDGVQQGIDNIVPYRWTIFDLAAGTHTLRVVATDDDGATAEETITISVSAPNTPPTISFVNPLDGDNFMDGDDLLVEATASDSDGSIANVQFIYDGVLQGTDNLNPYQWMLTNLTQGTHTLEVIATDDMGATANATATITVNTVTTPPTVSFVAPIDGEILAEGSNLSIEANATDSDGSIVGVQLFYDGILQGTDNTPAYQWIVPNLQIGTHTLQVVATDDNNATAQATVTITVNPVSFASDSGQQHTDNSVDMLAFVENSEADIAAAFVSNKTEYLTTNEEAYTMRMQPELIAVQNPAAPSDQQVTVNITANNLVNVVGVSHMLVWDPSVLRINRANPASNLTNLNTNISPAISTGQFTAVTDSTLGFSWIQFDVNQAQSLANGETLYSIVFDVVGAIGGGTL